MKMMIKPYNPIAEWRDPYGVAEGATCVVVARGLEAGKAMEMHVMCKSEDVEKFKADFKLYPGWVTIGYTIQEYLELNLGYIQAMLA